MMIILNWWVIYNSLKIIFFIFIVTDLFIFLMTFIWAN
jgi:hypothetical protein